MILTSNQNISEPLIWLNPAKKSINIQLYLDNQEMIEICVFDVQGRVLDHFKTGILNSGMNIINRDIGKIRPLPDGVFLLGVKTSKITNMKKILIYK